MTPERADTERVRIERMGFRGHGLARVDDRWVPIPGTDVGEEVEVGWTEDRRGRRWGVLRRVLVASPHRVDPGCGQAQRCPGCPLRHLSAARQGELEVEAHRDTLRRLAGVDAPGALIAPLARDGFRARAAGRWVQTPLRRLGIGGLPGHPDVSLVECPAQTAGTRALLAAVEAAGPELEQVVVEGAPGDGQIAWTTMDGDAPVVDVGAVSVVARRAHPRAPAARHVAGPTSAWFSVGADRLRVTAPAWRPQSPGSLMPLRAAVARLLEVSPADRVLEIGCGVGTLSLPIARTAESLVGVDMVRAAVLDAEFNAAAAGLDNASFRTGRAEHTLRRLLQAGARFDRVLLHAMRRPLGASVLRLVRALEPRRVLYLAPSVAALARDLERCPFAVERVDFLDQMPGTAQLLSLCVLRPAL